jgi:thiosulfate/3-mercaptopyruvate sulfurtransferase
MNKSITIFAFVILVFSRSVFAQTNSEPWKPEQLMAPAELATIINDSATRQPLIISVGPVGLIKGAVDIGPVHEKEKLDKLKERLAKEKKDRMIVIYCGCCPFEHCPNIRPAFKLLNEMKFTNQKLLNLPHNLKADWINSGYPMTTPQ